MFKTLKSTVVIVILLLLLAPKFIVSAEETNTKTVDGLTLSITANLENIKGDITKDNQLDENGEYYKVTLDKSTIVKASDYGHIVVDIDIKNDTDKTIEFSPFYVVCELQDGYKLYEDFAAKKLERYKVQPKSNGKYTAVYVVKQDIMPEKIRLKYTWIKNFEELQQAGKSIFEYGEFVNIKLETEIQNAPVISAKEAASNLVDVAINQKTFYHYNLAYAKIIKEDADTQAVLLSKLAAITDVVWTKEIKDINKLIEEMVKTKSGKTYDEIRALIVNSKTLSQVDKDYLLYELSSWGSNLIYTPDYKAGLDALLEANYKKTDEAVENAKNLILKIELPINREYLFGELIKLEELVKIRAVKGTREEPIRLKDKVKLAYCWQYWEKPLVLEMQLLDIAKGKEVNEIIAKESKANKVPKDDEEWVLMKFNVKYISGPQKKFTSQSIMTFYTGKGTKPIFDHAILFSGKLESSVVLSQGEEGVFYTAVLVKKSDEYPLISIPTDFDSVKYKHKYTWFTTNPN